MDYFFVRRGQGLHMITDEEAQGLDKRMYKAVLSICDGPSGAAFAAVTEKGPAPYAVAVVQEAFRFTGRKDYLALLDQESSINSLLDKFLEGHRACNVVTMNTPKGSSASAGGIERGNYEIERQARTLVARLEERYGIMIQTEDDIVDWLMRHAAWLITHFQVKVDGKTPFERLRERPYKGEIAEFGETVFFKVPHATLGKLDDRADKALWLGKTLKSDEHIVGRDQWAKAVRSIWRRPGAARWDKQLLANFKCKPSTTASGNPATTTQMSRSVEVQPRRVYITVDRILKFGQTPGCQGCRDMDAEHTAECVKRMTELVEQDRANKVARSVPLPATPTRTPAPGTPSATAETGTASGSAASGSAAMHECNQTAWTTQLLQTGQPRRDGQMPWMMRCRSRLVKEARQGRMRSQRARKPG